MLWSRHVQAQNATFVRDVCIHFNPKTAPDRSFLSLWQQCHAVLQRPCWAGFFRFSWFSPVRPFASQAALKGLLSDSHSSPGHQTRPSNTRQQDQNDSSCRPGFYISSRQPRQLWGRKTSCPCADAAISACSAAGQHPKTISWG